MQRKTIINNTGIIMTETTKPVCSSCLKTLDNKSYIVGKWTVCTSCFIELEDDIQMSSYWTDH